MNPQQMLMLMSMLDFQRNKNRRGGRKGRDGPTGPGIIRGNQGGRMYQANKNFPIPALGTGPAIPRGPDLGFGPGATPPGGAMNPQMLLGGLQGLGTPPPGMFGPPAGRPARRRMNQEGQMNQGQPKNKEADDLMKRLLMIMALQGVM